MLQHLAALNNASRLQIIKMLSRAPMSATHIAGRFSMQKVSVVKNLDILERVGIIRRTGTIYTANPFWVELVEKMEKACK